MSVYLLAVSSVSVVCTWIDVCACVHACTWAFDRERVCVRTRDKTERERERQRERERETEGA